MCSLDELLSQLFFKLGRSSIYLYVLQVLVQLQLIKLLFLELLKGFLNRHLRLQLLQKLVLFIFDAFHFQTGVKYNINVCHYS